MCLDSLFGGGKPQAQVVQSQGSSTPQLPKELAPFYKGAPKGFKPGADEGILYQASQQFNDPREYYPGETVVPFSELTQQGQQQTQDLAQQPNQLAGQSQQNLLEILQGGGLQAPINDIAHGNNAIDTSYLENVAQGGFLGQNPYIDNLVNQVGSDATQSVNRNAYFGGNEGSPYHAGAVAEGVGRATAPIRLQDYQSERGFQQSAINQLAGVQGANIQNQFGAAQGGLASQFQAQQQAPQVDEFQYANANRLTGLGGAQEGKQFEQIQDQAARHDFQQNERSDALARYAALVGGSPIYSNQTNQTFTPGPQTGFSGGGALGGAAQGAQLGSLFPGYGTLIGGGLGGLAGGFG